MQKEIVIVGAGLTGLMLSIYLGKRGYQVAVYDQRPDPRLAYSKYGSGRSMSLDLSVRGLIALSEIGLDETILASAVPMKTRNIHLPEEETVQLRYGKSEKDCIYAVSRAKVHKELLEKAESFDFVKINFNQSFVDFDPDTEFAIFKDEATGQRVRVQPFLLIGCDGVHSPVRTAIEKIHHNHFKKETFDYSYKELKIPSSRAEGLELQAMHMWPRKNCMLVAQPNDDGSFTCAILLPRSGPHSFDALISRGIPEVSRFFEENFGEVCDLIPNLVEDFLNNPLGILTSIREGQWSVDSKVLLMGDSVHAMLPFFGQGMNCCFEDCYLLNQYLNEFNNDWNLAIPAFEKNRKLDTHAITTLSLENYPELTSLNWRHFILHRKIEDFLMLNFKDVFTSYHNLVCFSGVPYRYAQAVKGLQKDLVERIAISMGDIHDLSKSRVAELMGEYQSKLNQLGEIPSYHKLARASIKQLLS
jgi:kynurenine 3-monooxygenase